MSNSIHVEIISGDEREKGSEGVARSLFSPPPMPCSRKRLHSRREEEVERRRRQSEQNRKKEEVDGKETF